MKLRNVVALVAIVGLTAQAHAADVLRRTETVAQVETTTATTVATPTAAPAASTTVEVKTVEAKPVETKTVETKIIETPVETTAASKAAELRKARVGEEVQTESKIVEKLESERLVEEQKRAERLFSDKKAAPAEKTEAVAPVAPTVRIEKVEIVQPQQIVAPAPVVVAPAPAPVAPAKTEAAPGAVAVSDAAPSIYKWYVGGLLAIPEYNSSQVKTNYGLGGTVGVMIDEDYALEGSFIFSNFTVGNNNNNFYYNSYGTNGFGRRDLDQYEVKGTFKWYALRSILGDSRLKPYIGGSVSYIYREYTRSNNNSNSYYSDYSYGAYGTSGQNRTQTSDSANVGALIGADVAISPRFSLGAAFEYSTPIMSNNNNNNNGDSNYYNQYGGNYYGNGSSRNRVENMDFTTISLNAKFTF